MMFYDETISTQIARHLANTQAQSISTASKHVARRALLDAYGVMLGASGMSDDVLPYRRLALVGRGPSRLIGLSNSTSPSLAAFANGALAHALDFGDTFDAGPAHPHAALVPALLALADARPATTLGEVLAAIVLGGDLACRLTIAAPRPYEEGGWYPPPLVNLIAGAGACARFLGLDAETIRNALGLAMLQGAFPGEIKYDHVSPVRGVREAFAARGAVEAALLASEGAIGFADPLTGKAGFFAIYGGGPPRDVLLTDVGGTYLNDRVSFKTWPSCRGTHPYIEAALEARTSIDLDDVDRIEAEIGPIQEMLIRPQASKAAPDRPVEAKFSIPFTVAAALIDGEVGLSTFAPEKLGDERLRAVAARVFEWRNPDWGRADAASGSLTFHMRDGRSCRFSVPQAIGHPDRPVSDEALIAKFVACAARACQAWPEQRASRFARSVLTSAEGRNVSDIFASPSDNGVIP